MIVQTLKCASGTCELRLNDTIDRLEELVDGRRAVIITDTNVNRLYRGRFCKAADVIVVEPGETSKSLKTATAIFTRFAELELDRTSLVIGVGGGVVTDLAGFVASTYLRGLSFGFVPTTLLGQVDAAVGGKNGVNLLGFKNLVGVIRQPKFVISDSSLLKTLPLPEVRCGLAETIKTAAIGDIDLFNLLESEADAIQNMETAVLDRTVAAAVAVKANIVEKDETEKGERRLLNFGHTLGHALERTTKIRHGEAVSVGMAAAARISEFRGLLDPSDHNRLVALLKEYKLPISADLDSASTIEALRRDKKRRGDEIDLVLLKGLGRGTIVTATIKEVEHALLDTGAG